MTVLTRGGFAYPGTTTAFKTGTWRVQRPVHRHEAAPCRVACPAGEDAQAYLAKIEEGRPREAWEILVSANPLPAITGRVCHHPCETDCNRAEFDEAISIHAVERHLGDEAIRHGWPYPVRPPAAEAPAVAVVGAGPAGLSAAYHLLRRGYRVSLFEATPEAGGTCRMAIPGYRLPAEVLAAEVQRLLDIGIEFLPQRKLGRDVSLKELRADYAAVFLGPGAQKGREWNVDGVVPRDLHAGLDLLKEWVALGSLVQASSIAIVGGGNTAIDLGRVLKRAGVSEVHVISHNAFPGPGVAVEDAMGAIPREIHQAQEEGIIVHAHRGIRRLILRGERVVGVEMVHMKKLSTVRGGKPQRVAFEGTETVLHVDQVIPAVGQMVDPAGMEAVLGHGEFVNVDAWRRVAGHEGVYAGGDACPDRGTVSASIGDGRRAAEGIDAYIKGLELGEGESIAGIPFTNLNLHYYEHSPRVQEPILPVEQRKDAEEIEGGLSANQVMHEARRCFSCGNCLACDNCWTLCPDVAVLKTKEEAEDGSHYVFDYDYCKGCGLCAHECPCGYIVMEEEM